MSKIALVNGFIPYIVTIEKQGVMYFHLGYAAKNVRDSPTGFVSMNSFYFPFSEVNGYDTIPELYSYVHTDRISSVRYRNQLMLILRYLTEVEQDDLGNPIVWDQHNKWIGPMCPIFNHLWSNLPPAQIMQ